MYHKAKLNNGLTIISHPMIRMQSVALGIWIKTGSRYEPDGLRGIAHFLEHLVFKGTKKYSCRKIKESLEGVGGALNGFTSEEFTCYLVKLPGRYLNLALDVLSDMALNPLLPEDEITREKTVVLEEIKMHKDLPQSYVHDLLDELLWPAQPLGMSILGTQESISRMNRQDLDLFRAKYYQPHNIVVSCAGLLMPDKLKSKLETIFLPRKKITAENFITAEVRQSSPQLKILNKDTEQTHLALGFHSFKREHPLKHAVALLHIILGANMSSRLFDEVREKRGLAYEIATHLKRFQDTGAFVVHAGIDNRKVSEAIELILKELQKIKDVLVSDDEFKRAKEFYLGQLMLALEDTLDHMLWIGETTASLDKTYSLKEVVKEVNQVKCQDIRQAARQIFQKQNLNLSLIGPLKDNQDKISSILSLN